MKRLLSVLLAIIMCFALMTACTQPENSDVTETPDEQAFESVEAFLEAFPEIEAEAKESLGDEMNVDLEARGNKLAYVYTAPAFDEIFSMGDGTVGAVEEIFDELFAGFVPTLANALIEMQESIPSMEAIIIEVKTSDGQAVYSKEIYPEDVNAEGEVLDLEALEDGMTLEQYAEMLGGSGALDNEAFFVDIKAQDNKLIYVYTLKEQIEVDDSVVADVQAGFAEMEETVSEMYDMIKAGVPELEAICYEYKNADGAHITDYTFTK